LDNFLSAISHLNTFRAFLDTLTASRLKASLAKEVVVDVIDCSAIDFKELASALRQIKQLDEYATLDGACGVLRLSKDCVIALTFDSGHPPAELLLLVTVAFNTGFIGKSL
jgi:hypothetical protein